MRELEAHLNTGIDNANRVEKDNAIIAMQQYADQFIASSQDGHGWIAVEDGLPKEDGNGNIPCLCWDDYHKQTRVLCYNEYHKCWDDESGDDYYTDAVGGKVTHYQPLPLPPKK